MVSTEIKDYFDQKVDKDFTGYLDNDKMNRLFKDTIYRVLNERIANLTTQKNYDEISFLLKTSQAYTPASNKIVLGITPITDVAVSTPFVYTITSGYPHNLINGDLAIISGVDGTTTANGSHVVTILSPTTFSITVAAAAGTYTANTGSFYTANQVSDYYRLLAIKTTFRTARTLSVTKANNSTPIRVSFSGVNNIRTGEQVFISGVLGNTNANGTFYVTKINSGTVDLYSNATFTTAVAGNGSYTSGGTLAVVKDEYASPINSDRKISELSQATIDYPKFEESQHSLVIYPTDYACVNASLDYIMVPKEIDFNDEDTNYTLYYNDKFLFYLIDQAAKSFVAQIRDTEGYQIMNQEVAQNK